MAVRFQRGAIASIVLGSSALLRAWPAGADALTAGAQEWPSYGRSADATHFSPLTDINASNVTQLGLAWWFDIPGVVLASSTPLEIDGVLYFATGYSVVRALDAATGRLLWTYDPQVPKLAGHKLRVGWGVRGIASWNRKIYVGTQDGRLIAIDARSGQPVWSVATVAADDLRFITGPPLVFRGKIMIGHSGSDLGAVRGYVTTYDAETGRQLWRFYTVPGNPADGFENHAMAMAAKTWTGSWWKFGGGGTVWNAMVYDAELKRVYIGTSNGAPWNPKIRSPGGGDNLFVDSIVALDADTGVYLWHYQTNPGDAWDFDADMDIELAQMVLHGKPRRVLMQASKNGFYYVIDRDTGKLISAEKFVKVSWADRIDLKTGRPVEASQARYPSGEAQVWPGSAGAHSAQAMAFNPSRHLAYIPALELPGEYDDRGIAFDQWQPNSDFVASVGIHLNYGSLPPNTGASFLLAWDPIRQRAAWRVPLPGLLNGGVATTAGNLVFQGRCDGTFAAYAADSGELLWSFDAQDGIIGAPISYRLAGRQYVSVLVGFAGPPAMLGALSAQFRWDARSQQRRVLTFALGADQQLPPPPPRYQLLPVEDPTFEPDANAERMGALAFANRCAFCHGGNAIAGGSAPDLRASALILSADTFGAVVHDGALLERGMPQFEEVPAPEIETIRQYLRARAHATRSRQ